MPRSGTWKGSDVLKTVALLALGAAVITKVYDGGNDPVGKFLPVLNETQRRSLKGSVKMVGWASLAYLAVTGW